MPFVSVNTGLSASDLNGENVGTSVLGTPVQSNIIFQEVSYDDFVFGEVNLTDPATEGEEYLRIDTVLFEVLHPKHVKRTRVPGADGTVKAYIGDGDHEVNMRGSLVNDIDQRPEELMQKLANITKAPVPIPVQSPYLSTLGIEDLVVLERRFDEQAGRPGEVAFQVRAVSEAPIEVRLNLEE